MKLVRLSAIPVLVLCVMLVGASSTLATITYSKIASIPVPGLRSFDISWVDRSTQTYYLADRTHAAVDVFNAENNTPITRFGGFVGFTGNNDTSGPNGVVVIHPEHEVWAGDGNSTVKVIDLASGQTVASISTGGTARADELAFDQKDHLLLAANDADDPPFVSLISVPDRTVVKKIVFSAANGVDATNGIEQPVWDPETHRFYVAVPQIGPNAKNGGIVVINPDTMQIETTFPVSECQPHGLALGPKQHLLLGCSGDAIAAGFAARSIVMDARDGSIVASLVCPANGSDKCVGGSDEVWFNPGDKRYYLAANAFRVTPSAPVTPVLGVIDAETNTWITNVSTGPIPPKGTAGPHSVAADPISNHIFVPLSELKNSSGNIVRPGQIAVFAAGE